MPDRDPCATIALDPGPVGVLNVHYQQVKLYQAELRSACRVHPVWWEEALLLLLSTAIAALLWSVRC